MPKGHYKDIIKLKYYNFFSKKNVVFGINFEPIKYFSTTYNDLKFRSVDPLYNVVPDFDFYQNFYKVKDNDVIIDAGSNCGYLALLFSKLSGKNGKVFAFEPDKFNIDCIVENINLNSDLENTIVIEDLLIWNKNTEIDFYEAGTVGSSAVWIPENAILVKKKAITIDSWVQENNIKKLDFIKMDIEGAEIEAIEGCLETIKTLKPNFAIASYHWVNGEQTYIKLEKMFEEMNYPYKTVKFNKTEIITFAGKI